MEKWDHIQADKAVEILSDFLGGFGVGFSWEGYSAEDGKEFGDGQHFVRMTVSGRFEVSIDLPQEFAEKLIWKIKETIRYNGERVVEDMLELGIIDREMIVSSFAGCVAKDAERVNKLLEEDSNRRNHDKDRENE